MDRDVRREIILENYQNPTHKGLVEDSHYMKINMNSETCIDNLDFMVKVQDGKIEDIRFDGDACAISTSASSILIQTLMGKKVSEAQKILENYQNMIHGEEYDEEILGELVVYDEIGKQPNRMECALLPSKAIDQVLDQSQSK